MAGYREVLFELTNGRPITPLFVALTSERAAQARLQALSIGHEVVSVLIDFRGSASATERVRRVITRRPEPTTVIDYDSLIDEPKHLRFVTTWRRPTKPQEGVSLEHILFDTAGPAAILFGRVQDATIAYKAASPDGRGLQEFVERVREAFGTRYAVRARRAGPFRTGWEIDDRSTRVDPDEEVLLTAALAAGYYDEPKRCGVRELGDVLGLSKSVIARRLRSLERRALEQLAR